MDRVHCTDLSYRERVKFIRTGRRALFLYRLAKQTGLSIIP